MIKIKKRKEAVALNYDGKQMDAPTNVAKGKGLIADKILAEAKEIMFQYKKILL
jgi:type III secretion system FlhB-like substrate exporter